MNGSDMKKLEDAAKRLSAQKGIDINRLKKAAASLTDRDKRKIAEELSKADATRLGGYIDDGLLEKLKTLSADDISELIAKFR